MRLCLSVNDRHRNKVTEKKCGIDIIYVYYIVLMYYIILYPCICTFIVFTT